MATGVMVEFNSFNTLSTSKEYPCQVSSRLTHWFRRRRYLKKKKKIVHRLTDGQMTTGQRPITIPPLSTSYSDDLKMIGQSNQCKNLFFEIRHIRIK